MFFSATDQMSIVIHYGPTNEGPWHFLSDMPRAELSEGLTIPYMEPGFRTMNQTLLLPCPVVSPVILSMAK